MSKCDAATQLMRTLFLFTAKHNLMLKAQYIPGVNNRAADALSMNDKDSFFLLVVGARRDPTPISAEVTEALLFHPQDWTSAKVSKPLCKG